MTFDFLHEMITKKQFFVDVIFLAISAILSGTIIFFAGRKIEIVARSLSRRASYFTKRSFPYFIFGIVSMLFGAGLSAYFDKLHFLIILGSFVISLGITRMIADLLEQDIFFNLNFIYGIMMIVEDIPILNLFYKEIMKIKLNLIIFQVSLPAIARGAIYILIIYNIYNAMDRIIFKLLGSKQNTNRHLIAQKVIGMIFYLIIVIVCLRVFDVKKESILMLAGSLGIGVGFGIQKIFSSAFSGLLILYEQSIRVGDFITMPDKNISGTVVQICRRYVMLRSAKGESIVIPNDVIIGSPVVNMDLEDKLYRVDIDFTIDQSYDLSLIREQTLTLVKANPFVHKALCLIDGVNQDGFMFSLRVFMQPYDNPDLNIWELKSNLIIDLQKKLKEFNVKFANHKIQSI